MPDKVNTKLSSGILIAGALIALVIFFVGRSEAPDTEVSAISAPVAEHLSVAEFKEEITDKEVIIIDVRTLEEYESGSLEGALNIDFYNPEFASEIETLDVSKSYALYCRTGNRSGQALRIMKEKGFANVVDLSGGIVAWTSAGESLCDSEKVCLR